MKKLRFPTLSILLPSLVLILLLNIFWAHFIRKEKTLYAWDHVAYWSMSLNLAEDFLESPGAAISEIAASVWKDEVNLLPSVLPALALAPTGGSRTAYILAILNLYSIPAIFLGFLLFLKLGGSPPAPGLAAWLCALLLLPACWQPLSLGYPGSGGMALVFLILALAWREDADGCEDTRKTGWSQLLAMALLLALLTLFRRWWAFWSLSFCLVWAGDRLIRAGIYFSSAPARARNILKDLLILGASVGGLLLLIGGPRIVTIARTDYAGKFIHYKGHHGLHGAFSLLEGEFGLLGLLLLVVLWLLLLFERKWRSKAIFLAAHCLLTAGLFFRVQDPSPQHWYLLMPAALLIPAAGIQTILQKLRPSNSRSVFAILCLVGILLNGVVFGLNIPGLVLGPRIRIEPTRRTDLEEIRQLMAFLDEREESQKGWIYVLSGTGKLPESGLAFINLSLGTHYRSPARILESRQVDLRDGFPRGLFQAHYILVPQPPQCRGTTQRVIQLPAKDFQQGTGIASAFSAVGRIFHLADGIEVRVFERVRPSSREEIEGLSRRLRSFYPEAPKVWRPSF